MNTKSITSNSKSGFLPDELITRKELALKLKFTPHTVDRLTRQGVIPMLRVGSSPRYCWHDVFYSIKNEQA
jgi:hypothetical protein